MELAACVFDNIKRAVIAFADKLGNGYVENFRELVERVEIRHAAFFVVGVGRTVEVERLGDFPLSQTVERSECLEPVSKFEILVGHIFVLRPHRLKADALYKTILKYLKKKVYSKYKTFSENLKKSQFL